MRGFRVRLSLFRVFNPFGVFALCVMFGSGAVRLGGSFVMFGGFGVRLFGHFHLPIANP
jgi:hypothetical protein